MSKNIRIIYLYLVCLIMIVLAVGGFILTINYFSSYLFPTSYYSDVYSVYYSNSKISDLKASITSFAASVVSGLIFIYNWRKIEKERKEMEE